MTHHNPPVNQRLGSPERPAEHLDRVWPDTDPEGNRLDGME